MNINKHNYLKDKERYVLVDLGDNRYIIYDIVDKAMIINEIDEEKKNAIKLMLDNNSKILKPTDINNL